MSQPGARRVTRRLPPAGTRLRRPPRPPPAGPPPAGATRRKTAVPRARSGPIASASSSQTDRVWPSFSYVRVDSLPLTITGSPLRSDAAALSASVAPAAHPEEQLARVDPALAVPVEPPRGRGDPEPGHVLAGLDGAQLGVVDQVAHHGHERLVQRRTPLGPCPPPRRASTGRCRVGDMPGRPNPHLWTARVLWTTVRQIRTTLLPAERSLRSPQKSSARPARVEPCGWRSSGLSS